MNYWWVNQNQTFSKELKGGYLWSPKRNSTKDGGVGSRNQFYENMQAVVPGDIVFSFYDTHVSAIGTVQSYGYDSPRPEEFGTAGEYWSKSGWKVDVVFTKLDNPIRPKEHIDQLRDLLPEKYSFLRRETGDGMQHVYLAFVPEQFAHLLLKLLEEAGNQKTIIQSTTMGIQESDKPCLDIEAIENQVENRITSEIVSPTVKQDLIASRRGQGRFRENVRSIEKGCRISGVTDSTFLIASHIKPWRLSTDEERLNGHNGLLLVPNADRLFDRGFISFDDDGTLLISPVMNLETIEKLGVCPSKPINVGNFTGQQKKFLLEHRQSIFLHTKPGIY